MKYGPRRAQAIVLLLGLAGAAWCAALFLRHGVRDIFAATLAAGSGVAAVLVCHFLPLLCDVASWTVLIPPRLRPALRNLALIRWIGDSVCTMLPVAQVGGELVRVRLSTFFGISFATATASVLVGMTVAIFTQILFALSGLWVLLILTGQHGSSRATAAGVIICLAALAGFYFVQRSGIFRLGGAWIARITKAPAWRELANHGQLVDETIRDIYNSHRSLLWCAFWNTAAWTSGALEVWIALRALGKPVGYGQAYVLESATQMIRSMLFVVPGALGAQETGYLAVGAMLGISSDMAMALALIRRVREVAFGLPGVLAWQWLEWRQLRPTA